MCLNTFKDRQASDSAIEIFDEGPLSAMRALYFTSIRLNDLNALTGHGTQEFLKGSHLLWLPKCPVGGEGEPGVLTAIHNGWRNIRPRDAYLFRLFLYLTPAQRHLMDSHIFTDSGCWNFEDFLCEGMVVIAVKDPSIMPYPGPRSRPELV